MGACKSLHVARCPSASWARLLLVLLSVFLPAFSAIASSNFLAPTTEPSVEQAVASVSEPAARTCLDSSGPIAKEIGKHLHSLRDVGHLQRVSKTTRALKPTVEQVVDAIPRKYAEDRRQQSFLVERTRDLTFSEKLLLENKNFETWSDLDEIPEEVRHSPAVVARALLFELLVSREQWDQLPVETRRAEACVVGAIRQGILTVWDNNEDFPEEVRASPKVVSTAIHNSLLTTRAQWCQLPVRVRQDEGVGMQLFLMRPFPLTVANLHCKRIRSKTPILPVLKWVNQP